jgi:hypothetical protein
MYALPAGPDVNIQHIKADGASSSGSAIHDTGGVYSRTRFP